MRAKATSLPHGSMRIQFYVHTATKIKENNSLLLRVNEPEVFIYIAGKVKGTSLEDGFIENPI